MAGRQAVASLIFTYIAPRMAPVTIANIPRLSPIELSEILLADVWGPPNVDASVPSSKIAIVDVRDDDHIGGHIKHSIHAPSGTLDHRIPELVRTLHDKEIVVFHCALSQQRGPAAALRYYREQERLLGDQNKFETRGRNSSKQQVYILDKGFVGWQKRFGQDTRLTAGYRKELWS